MTYKIVFFDIDGTILKPDHTYETSTKEAIARLHDKGIQVALATGRPTHELENLATDLNVNLLIGYNGANARYKGDTIYEQSIDRQIVNKLLQVAQEHGDEMVFYTEEQNLFLNLNSENTSM